MLDSDSFRSDIYRNGFQTAIAKVSRFLRNEIRSSIYTPKEISTLRKLLKLLPSVSIGRLARRSPAQNQVELELVKLERILWLACEADKNLPRKIAEEVAVELFDEEVFGPLALSETDPAGSHFFTTIAERNGVMNRPARHIPTWGNAIDPRYLIPGC